tara:strand:+ start:1176 stop:1370 length:195 start_codon:yes stop_codon:yes gene_type:complete
MLSHNLKVKGYINEEFGAEPEVTFEFKGILSMEELQNILEVIRKPWNDMGESLSFNITFQDLDL